ncbi:MAG TPA: hypothetical protein VFP80_06515 [Thermoanaerobaculia bacterium]|nr:hypothetical protein [Thermoanaerobaculia bacterium]
MSSRPDLIVPIRDRRRRKRILTLKHFGIVMAVLAVAFVAISIRSEMRGLGPSGYGRLFNREVPPAVEAKPMEVVHEAEPAAVADQTHVDPMLVQPMERSQWLVDETAATTATVVPVVNAASVRGDGDVAIVGGSDGVTVVRQERRKPVLSGGFGR